MKQTGVSLIGYYTENDSYFLQISTRSEDYVYDA